MSPNIGHSFLECTICSIFKLKKKKEYDFLIVITCFLQKKYKHEFTICYIIYNILFFF